MITKRLKIIIILISIVLVIVGIGTYCFGVQSTDIQLLLNGEPISSDDDLIQKAIEKQKEIEQESGQEQEYEHDGIKFGVNYPMELSVKNTGNEPKYVKVTIKRYWSNSDGTKNTSLDSVLMDFHLVNLGDTWLMDDAACTAEDTIIWWNSQLQVGKTTDSFCDTFCISPVVKFKVEERATDDGQPIFRYKDKTANLEITVDFEDSLPEFY